MSAGAPSPAAAAPLALVAFAAGACTMAVELAAVRLLAPWYGASSTVWTNVIGVVLVALTAGYLLGARLAVRAEPARALGLGLCLGGAACAWLPALARPAARAFLPPGLQLEEVGELVGWGSLASALCLFAPASFALGTVAPLVTECVQRRRGGTAGQAGGLVLAASTLGSLAGTFATTYLLVPRLGLSATYVGAGLSLAACGVPFLVRHGRRAAGVLCAAVVTAGALHARVERPAPEQGARVLEERETRYQSARVVEVGQGTERLRLLQVNESVGSFQSVWQPEPGFLPPGHYYNLFALPPLVAARPGRWRLAVLGLGAGTTWRVLDGALPADVTLETWGVEIDPDVVELGRAWLDLAPDGDPLRTVVAGVDARAALRALPADLDQIVVDAYQNQVEIPPQLASLEFFEACRALLAPGGWLSANVGAFGLDDPVLEAFGATASRAFGARVLALRVPFARNVLVLARRDRSIPEPGDDGWHTGVAAADRIVAAAALPGMWRWIEARDGPLCTDDKNPIEELQRRSILRALHGGSP